MKADAKTEAEVKKTIAKMTDFYEKRNLSGMMGCFARDDDIVVFGTGVDEVRIGRAQIETQVTRDWEQTEAVAMRFKDLKVCVPPLPGFLP